MLIMQIKIEREWCYFKKHSLSKEIDFNDPNDQKYQNIHKF